MTSTTLLVLVVVFFCGHALSETTEGKLRVTVRMDIDSDNKRIAGTEHFYQVETEDGRVAHLRGSSSVLRYPDTPPVPSKLSLSQENSSSSNSVC
jgi:hypothetical protein